VTSDIASATGVEQRGRIGFTAVTVSALFLAALFFSAVDALLLGYFVLVRSRL
jgi:xanthine/uracil/vitamin C permease (AzgA family)